MTRPRRSSTQQGKALALAGSLPLARWHPAVLARAKARRTNETWAVALSGGADSVALLLLLWAHFPARRGRLCVLHFNHRLRGRAADADERFCARLCAALEVDFVAERWARAAGAKSDHVSEAGARAARHGFFARAMKRRRAKVLWLAQQQDDIAETMLMRLARGSGTGGLAAPRPVQVFTDGRIYLRPLLTLSKAGLVAALRAAGAAWREDATNESAQFFRNRIRRSILPAWAEAAGRDALAGAALARERLEEDDVALEAWMDELAPFTQRGRGLLAARLAGKPPALWRRALHRWLLAVRPDTDLSRQGFDQLLAAVRRGRDTRFSLGPRDFAVLRDGELRLQRR